MYVDGKEIDHNLQLFIVLLKWDLFYKSSADKFEWNISI